MHSGLWSREIDYLYFQRLKKIRPRRLGAPECRGALVHCTTCTTYCYATESDATVDAAVVRGAYHRAHLFFRATT